MKNLNAKFVLKVAGTLTAIALVVAALLGLVNHITKDRIAELTAAATREALAAVTPEGSTCDAVDITAAARDAASAQGGKLLEMYTVSTGGYACKVSASGSQGTIVMIVGVDAEGKITGISIVDNAETSGIGSKVMDNLPNAAGVPVLDQFIGMSDAGTLVVNKTVTAITGATVSTKGVTMGANAALAAVAALG
ncbi:MAG: FMN-binding protein [Oscillospiraceae bacterium]|jgi:electron transport complex protein RnfG|nr:FMN-binding protein [Oscillospiraceae bacterium]